MRETDLVVNVQSAVEDFYPGLTQKQKDLLTEKIFNNFDYSGIYNQIHDDLDHYAYSEKIQLEGKDGINEVEDKTLLGTSDGTFYYKNGDNVIPLFQPHIDPYGGH